MFKPSTKEQWMGLSGVCESTILFAASFASSAATNSSHSALIASQDEHLRLGLQMRPRPPPDQHAGTCMLNLLPAQSSRCETKVGRVAGGCSPAPRNQ